MQNVNISSHLQSPKNVLVFEMVFFLCQVLSISFNPLYYLMKNVSTSSFILVNVPPFDSKSLPLPPSDINGVNSWSLFRLNCIFKKSHNWLNVLKNNLFCLWFCIYLIAIINKIGLFDWPSLISLFFSESEERIWSGNFVNFCFL